MTELVDTDIACACYNATVEDIKEDYTEGMSFDNFVECAEVGDRCRACLKESCTKVDTPVITVFNLLSGE